MIDVTSSIPGPRNRRWRHSYTFEAVRSATLASQIRMSEDMLVDILVFVGLMAGLGAFVKLTLTFLNRRRLPSADAAATIVVTCG